MSTKNVLLIGSSGGLGRYFAKGLAQKGYNVALHYHNGKDNIEKLISELNTVKTKIEPYKADITSEKDVSNLVENVNKDFGSIDILINNAGITKDRICWKLEMEIWNEVLGVNLTGPFLCIKHTLPLMRKNNWGRIINISSVVPQLGVPGTSAYSASKSALTGLTKTVSKEVIKNNITVNLIALGYFNTGILFQIPPDIREQIKENIPKHEFGNPEEILNCISYLCGENASYITGQTININGGLY